MDTKDQARKSVEQENMAVFSSFKDAMSALDRSAFNHNKTHGEHTDIVSRFAYLIGVKKNVFENQYESPDIDVFNELEKNKSARIIRNLCRQRTSIELNYKRINDEMVRDYKTITSSSYMPQDAIMQLTGDGIDLYRFRRNPNEYLIEINRNIQSRINNCKDVFPAWINWEYIRRLFVVKNGITETGIREAVAFYYAHKEYYPYQVFMYWPDADNYGNILYNDKKFVELLYKWNNDEFRDYSRVSDVNEYTKNNIYDFIEQSEKTVFMVDCENSDPYALCAAIKNLDQEKLKKIQKIVLYDDVHAASGWDILSDFVGIPIEYILIDRLLDHKSLADIKLAAGTCKEHYENHVDSFVLVSSDSDYWGLIESIPEARFLVMVEHAKCSGALKDALISKGIFYCYIDDFHSKGSTEIKQAALIRETKRYLAANCNVNIMDLMNEILTLTRIDMNESEQEQFINKYLKTMKIGINEDGNVQFEIKKT